MKCQYIQHNVLKALTEVCRSKGRTQKQLKNFARDCGRVCMKDILIESRGCEKFLQRRKSEKRISDKLIYADLEVR